MNTEKTLKERGETYGSFSGYATICNQLKVVSRCAYNCNLHLENIHTEALDMIFSKIARILNGDPNHIDSWHDIAGHATLVEKELLKREESNSSNQPDSCS